MLDQQRRDATLSADDQARRALRWTTSLIQLADLAASDCSAFELWFDAVRRSADDLDGDASIALHLVDVERMQIVAACSWPTPVDGGLVPIAPDSQAAFVLATAEPVHTVLATERRFTPSRLVRDAGFGSSIISRVGTAGHPLGVIGVQYQCDVVDDGASGRHLGALARVLALGLRCRQIDDAASHQIDHDALTGLVNRRGLFEELQRIADAGSGGSVILMDLDGFKAVNDTYGHAAGDEVLRTIGERLRSSVRPTDLVARLSGDEFVVVGRGSDAGSAANIAERLIGHLEQAIAISAGSAMLSASAGVSVIDDRQGPAAALAAADAAMYAAKSAGRGLVRIATRPVAPDTREPARPRSTVTGASVDLRDVDRAIDAAGVVFQPIVDAITTGLVGVEALTRGPAGTALEDPLSLFRIAETWGRLPQLELAVKRRAFQQPIPAGCALFVNIDPTALLDPSFIADLRSAWHDADLDRSLVVELTERHLNTSPRMLLRAIDECREAGWLVALDDVGARNESLTALPLVRPDIVKLDMSLLNTANQHHVAATTVALAGYTERRSIRIVAEGVETLADAETARALGATHLQGYLFGRPGPLSALDIPTADDSATWWNERDLLPGSPRRATKGQLVALSRYVETLASSTDSVVLASLQHVRHYTPATRRQYAALARRCGMVGVIGVDVEPGMHHGVHHGRISSDDPLAGHWSVLVLQPTGSVAVFADEVDPTTRSFTYRITRNHDDIDAAARRLIQTF